MNVIDLIIIAVGLSMDAFAVSVCKGLALKKIRFKHMLTVGLYFGIFQAVMPLIGYFVAGFFAEYLSNIDHWIAFILLAGIGANMIKESFKQDCPDCENPGTALKSATMFMLAIATSIDALVVGTSLALLSANIFFAVALIGTITLLLSMLGVKIGAVFGARFKSKAEFAGGVILIFIGLKILLEHLGILVL